MYYFIYPSKDTYIYQLKGSDRKNFGGDDKLLLTKSDRSLNPSYEVKVDENNCPECGMNQQSDVEFECYFEDYDWNAGFPNSLLNVADVTYWSSNCGGAAAYNYVLNVVAFSRRRPPKAPKNNVSRILLDFDMTELSKSIIDSKSGNPSNSAKYYLRLYEKKSSNLSPEYALTAHAMSQSWEQGTGTSTENPNKKDGVSWWKGNEIFPNTSWSYMNVENDQSYDFSKVHSKPGTIISASYGGGAYWISGSCGVDMVSSGMGFCHNAINRGWQPEYQASQSFSYESPNIKMDITDMVKSWLGGSNKIPNDGLILRWSGSQENNPNYTGEIEFHSFDAQNIYSPKIEVVWAEDEYNDIEDDNLNKITHNQSSDLVFSLPNLQSEYSKNSWMQKIKVLVRNRYEEKTLSSRLPKIISQRRLTYSIIDVETGDVIVPFSERNTGMGVEAYSWTACDQYGMYFNLNLSTFIKNRKYKILLRSTVVKGHTDWDDIVYPSSPSAVGSVIYDNDWEFKVVN